MELQNIPVEQFYEFCESLNTRELSKLAQTNKENYLICKRILDERGRKVSDELVGELVGNWYNKEEYRLMMESVSGSNIPLRFPKLTSITSDSESVIVKTKDVNIKSEIISRENVTRLNSLLKHLKRDYQQGIIQSRKIR